MMRSTKVFGRSLLAGAVAVLMAATLGAPAGAAASKSSLSITSVAVGKTLGIAGKFTAGSDALGVLKLADDADGDDTLPIPNGNDFVSAQIKGDPVKRILTFSFTVSDPDPFFTITPGFDILWQFSVDGKDTSGYHLQIGNVGGLPPGAGPYFLLCTLNADGFACDHQLKGSFNAGVVTAEVPFDLIGANPGSVIGTSKAGAGVDTLTSNPGMGAIVFWGGDEFGDSMHAPDFSIPGGVKLGIAPAGTNPLKVPTTVVAKVKGTGFSGALPRPKPGSYVLVAKSCYGPKTCLIYAKTIKV